MTETAEAETPWKIRVGIGVPSPGEWKSGFGHALVQMIGYFERCHAHLPDDVRPEIVLVAVDGHLPEVRHRIAGEAVLEKCTHLLWLDSDMIFPPDTLHRLLRHNVAVVGVNYPRRTWPHIPTSHAGGEAKAGIVWSEEGKTGIEEVKHVGLGVCLMDIRVFDAIEPPYFMFEPDPKTRLNVRGEDVFFFEKLRREAGIPTYIDHDLSREVGHVGEMIFTLAHAWAARQVETTTGEQAGQAAMMAAVRAPAAEAAE